MGQVLFKFLVGGIAGLIGWMIMEPFAPRSVMDPAWPGWEAMFMFVLGAFIGGAVGFVDGFSRGGKIHTLRGLGLGVLFGAVGASLGHSIGGGLVSGIFGPGVFVDNSNFVKQVIARMVAFAPIGCLLGAAIGASSLTAKRVVQGAIGGIIGAAIGGSVFDVIGAGLGQAMLASRGVSNGEVGTPSRAVTAVVLGAMIGLFIGLVERFSRSAWLKLILGRNEGKEWSIDTSPTYIGRNEGAHVPLFGDANVGPVHASIVRQGRQYILTDAGTPVGTYVNGQRIQQVALAHGMQIQIGGFQLYFLEKNQPAPQRAPEAMHGQAYNPGQVPQAPAAFMPHAPMPTQGMAVPSMPTQAYGPQAAASGYVLVALDGPLLGQRFPISVPVEVGRESATISLAFDTAASRRHASLTPGAIGVAVSDLGSTNGTYVNGQRVSQANASPGDMIKIGSTTFRVETN